MFSVRRLTIADAEAFRSVRLEGLETYPQAFGASFADEAAQELEFFARRLERDAMFGGFVGPELLGVAGFFSEETEKTGHKGALYGMYVRQKAREKGMGLALVNAVLDHARGEVEIIQLTVVNSNRRARELYEKCGFEAYGIEPRALKVDGMYLDEALMWQSLT